MATYNYKCLDCEIIEEKMHSMKDSPQYKCSDCEGLLKKMMPNSMNFILKGMSWSGKNNKEKSYRSTRHRVMGKKMAKAHDIPQIQPNYKGEVCSSWEESKKLAKEDGVNTLRYEKQIDNLKSQQNKIEEKRKKLLKGQI